jgi:hypothetical protein
VVAWGANVKGKTDFVLGVLTNVDGGVACGEYLIPTVPGQRAGRWEKEKTKSSKKPIVFCIVEGAPCNPNTKHLGDLVNMETVICASVPFQDEKGSECQEWHDKCTLRQVEVEFFDSQLAKYF